MINNLITLGKVIEQDTPFVHLIVISPMCSIRLCDPVKLETYMTILFH